jgi:hypothetical protein
MYLDIPVSMTARSETFSSIYSTMTGLVFGKVFFSGSDPLIDTLKAFGVFLSVSLRARSAPRSSAIMAVMDGAMAAGALGLSRFAAHGPQWDGYGG